MTIAVLLRVLYEQVEQGNVVGRAEVVETGEVFAFRDAAELTAGILQLTSQRLNPSAPAAVRLTVAEEPA